MSVYTHYSFQAGSSFPTWSSWTWAWQWTPTWGENLALSSTSIMSRYFRDVSRRVFNRRSLSLMYFTSHLMNTMNDNWKQNFPLARSVRRSVGHIGWSVDRLVGPSKFGRSVGRLIGWSVRLNSEQFLRHCSCPTVRDWIAVYSRCRLDLEIRGNTLQEDK